MTGNTIYCWFDPLTKLFQSTKCELQEDKALFADLKQQALDLEDCQVPPKYHTEAPWPFAAAQIRLIILLFLFFFDRDLYRKINSYKSPYDKFVCISRCWEIISNCVSLLDDPGPDTCWPIMLYLVAQSEVEGIFSDIQYPFSTMQHQRLFS